MSFPIGGNEDLRIKENKSPARTSPPYEIENDTDISIFLNATEEENTNKNVNLISQDSSILNKVFNIFSSDNSKEISSKVNEAIFNYLENPDTNSVDTNILSGAMEEIGNILSENGINQNLISTDVINNVTNELIAEYAKNKNISGTININGTELDASKIADVFIDTLGESVNASGEMFGSLISNSLEVSKGTKTKEESGKSFLESCTDFFKGIGDSLNKFLEESGLSKSLEKMKDLYKNNIKTFLGSFLKNALKTLITNPASLADPVTFLTQTLISTVSDKNFQAGMAKNFSEFLGSDTNSEEYQQIFKIAQMALKSSQSANL